MCSDFIRYGCYTAINTCRWWKMRVSVGGAMINDAVLVNDWHPVALSKNVAEGGVLGARLLEEDIVAWRYRGQIMVWQDLCLHRGTRLSLGKVEDGLLVCPYHGWTYDMTGRCVRIPAHPAQLPPSRAVVNTYRAQERYELIWV